MGTSAGCATEICILCRETVAAVEGSTAHGDVASEVFPDCVQTAEHELLIQVGGVTDGHFAIGRLAVNRGERTQEG